MGCYTRPGRRIDDAVRERFRFLDTFHECAVAGLHVHDQRAESRGNFFRQNRCGNQRYRRHGRRDIANSIEPPVRWGEVGRLADDRTTCCFDYFFECLEIRGGVVSRDSLNLVCRAAGVAEPAPGDHGHEAATGGRNWRKQKTDLVADAAGRVFIDDRSPHFFLAPVKHGAGIRHRDRQLAGLVETHRVEEYRHRQR